MSHHLPLDGVTQDPSKPNLSDKEIEEIIDDWTPEPLVPELTQEEQEQAENVPVR